MEGSRGMEYSQIFTGHKCHHLWVDLCHPLVNPQITPFLSLTLASEHRRHWQVTSRPPRPCLYLQEKELEVGSEAFFMLPPSPTLNSGSPRHPISQGKRR